MKTLADFTQLVNLCLAIAAEKYGEMPKVTIRYDIRGKTAGVAGCKRNRLTGEAVDLYLRFNREAIEKNWDEMVTETIPHEVAHLVAYAFPRLGADNHNYAWKRISQSLGCSGARCHKMELTPGRKTNRFIYVTERGEEVVVGPKHHSGLQSGKYGFLRSRRTGERIGKEHFKQAA